MSDCTPNFVPSTTGCEISTNSETKARLLAGGTLFRSVKAGVAVNNISISNTWIVCIGGGSCDINNPVFIRDYNLVTDVPCDVVATRLDVFDNAVLVETYTVSQFNILCPGSPTPVVFSGIPELRSILTGTGSPAQLVVMPPLDAQTPAVALSGHTTWDASQDDAAFLSQFSATILNGGTGLNTNPTMVELDAIRTGPAFTLAHVGQTELTADPLNNGVINENISVVRYWNGVEWALFDVINLPDSCDAIPHI